MILPQSSNSGHLPPSWLLRRELRSRWIVRALHQWTGCWPPPDRLMVKDLELEEDSCKWTKFSRYGQLNLEISAAGVARLDTGPETAGSNSPQAEEGLAEQAVVDITKLQDSLEVALHRRSNLLALHGRGDAIIVEESDI